MAVQEASVTLAQGTEMVDSIQHILEFIETRYGLVRVVVDGHSATLINNAYFQNIVQCSANLLDKVKYCKERLYIAMTTSVAAGE